MSGELGLCLQEEGKRRTTYLEINFHPVNEEENDHDEEKNGITAVKHVSQETLKNKTVKRLIGSKQITEQLSDHLRVET